MSGGDKLTGGAFAGRSDTVTVSQQRIGNWDGWRGMAILLVLCGHFYDVKWLWEDRLGVDIFFVLSGMLMSIILFEKRLSLRDFYIRRLSRVYPALLVYVVAMFGVSWLYSQTFSVSELISTLLFLRTYYPTEPGIWDSEVAIGHIWSLNVEEHAYILLSVISLLLVNRQLVAWLLLMLGAGCIILSFYYYNLLSVEDFALYMIRTESAVVFIFLSAGYGLLRRQHGWALDSGVPVACVVAAMVCYANALPVWLVFSLSPVLLAVAVNHLDNLPGLINKMLLSAPLRVIGLWSYSIYLWQQFFYAYSWSIPFGKPMALLLALMAGVGSYYLLERPVRRILNAKWSANPVYRTGSERI